MADKAKRSGSSDVKSVADIEAAIGKTPAGIALKVIDHIDDHAGRWIAASPIGFFGFAKPDGVSLTIGGGAEGFAISAGHELHLPKAQLDDDVVTNVGAGFGSLFLVPGKRETVRVNGTVLAITDDQITIKVEECYGHCAKAFIRSNLWGASPRDAAPQNAADFLAASSFMVLATCDANGRTDVSPKGDPAGMLIREDGDEFHFAERPGNRRADGFRNIVTQRHVALMAMVPGTGQLAKISGAATLTTDEALRDTFVVEGRTPKLVVRLAGSTFEVVQSDALTKASLWPASDQHPQMEAAKMFAAHMKMNMNKGVKGRMASAALSVPGVVKGALNKDYKDNLY